MQAVLDPPVPTRQAEQPLGVATLTRQACDPVGNLSRLLARRRSLAGQPENLGQSGPVLVVVQNRGRNQGSHLKTTVPFIDVANLLPILVEKMYLPGGKELPASRKLALRRRGRLAGSLLISTSNRLRRRGFSVRRRCG